MKRLSLTFLFATMFLVSGCSNQPLDSFSTVNTTWITRETVGDFILRQLHGAKQQTLVSARFNVQFSLPASWRFAQEQKSRNALASYVFTRKNEDTSEQSHRDTPNGFNTASQDTGQLDMYSNSVNLTTETLRDFQKWHEESTPGRQIGKIQQRTIGRLSLLYAQEADGIESTGQYYYVLTPSHIFVFGTSDIPDADMITIFRSLTVGE